MPGENDKQIVKKEMAAKPAAEKKSVAPVADGKVKVAEAKAKPAKAPVEADGAKAVIKKPAAKLKEVAAHGQAHITATYNNTIVTLTDAKGNVISWASAGKAGFKGPKKSTAYAAGIVVKDAATPAYERGLREVDVFVRGVGAGREAAVRALNANGLIVNVIKDVTPIPHNGPRPRKVRRV